MPVTTRASALCILGLVLSSGCASAPWKVWKLERQAELEAGSIVATTALGPVEYAATGKGPVVLALHGAMGGYDSGLAIGQLIQRAGVTIVSVSRPGYLRTPIETGRSTEEQADALLALMDVLGIPWAAVAGGSAGGPVAVQFALRHPDRCWGLILLCSVFESKDLQDFSLFERLMLSSAFNDRNSYRVVSRMQKHPEQIMAGMHPGAAVRLQEDSRLMELAIRFMHTSFPMTLREVGTYNDMRSSQSVPHSALPAIRVPTLILHGTRDEWAPIEPARAAAAQIPNARLVEFEDGDHLFFITHMEEFQDAVCEFVATHAPDADAEPPAIR